MPGRRRRRRGAPGSTSTRLASRAAGPVGLGAGAPPREAGAQAARHGGGHHRQRPRDERSHPRCSSSVSAGAPAGIANSVPTDTRRGAAATILIARLAQRSSNPSDAALPLLCIASSTRSHRRTCGRSAAPGPRLARVCPPGPRVSAPLQVRGRRGRLRQVRAGVGTAARDRQRAGAAGVGTVGVSDVAQVCAAATHRCDVQIVSAAVRVRRMVPPQRSDTTAGKYRATGRHASGTGAFISRCGSHELTGQR